MAQPFRKAKAEQAALKIGMYGPAGSGKTFTALLVAEGLAKREKKRIAFVDTERGTDFYCKEVPAREAHSAAFDFDALYSRSLTEVTKAAKELDPKIYSVLIIDSITHLWEAARNAYEGRTNRAGQIPFHAWGKIKKPYKELINFLLSTTMHIIICGRQGNEYGEDDDTGELKMLGYKMKAEGETPYEPHILLRMEAKKQKQGQAIVTAFAEKDRTGTLAGKTIIWPDFEKIAGPVLSLLGDDGQAAIPTEDEVAQQDAEALDLDEHEKEKESAELVRKLKARLEGCDSVADLKKIGKEITPALKGKLTGEDHKALRDVYLERQEQLK